MNYTEHLELNKPERAEQFNIDHWNDNSDKIDSAIYNEVTRATGVETDLQTQIEQNRNEERRIGTVPISKGGTGNTTAQDALNALHGNVATQASINADDEITFIRRTPADLSLERPESIDVKDATLNTIANKVFDLLKVNSANLFGAENNGLVPAANNAGSASYLSATGEWNNPVFSENKINVTLSRSFAIENNTILNFTASEAVTIVLDDCEKLGCTVTIINKSAVTHSLSCRSPSSLVILSILPNAYFKIAWNGTEWVNITAPAVASTFVQYPNEQPPEVVYPCSKWKKLNFGGAFFRSSGGNAQAFNNQTAAQSESLPNITGSLTASSTNEAIPDCQYTGTGAISSKKSRQRVSLYTPTEYDGWSGFNFDASLSKVAYGKKHNGNEEVAPKNYTVQIWKRIA